MPADFLLAYDAECGPCSRFRVVVEFLDARGRLEFSSLEEADEAGSLAAVEPGARYRSFHLVAPGSRALSGAEALLPLVRVLFPRGAALTRGMEKVPGVRALVALGYSALSRLHDSGSCGLAAR